MFTAVNYAYKLTPGCEGHDLKGVLQSVQFSGMSLTIGINLGRGIYHSDLFEKARINRCEGVLVPPNYDKNITNINGELTLHGDAVRAHVARLVQGRDRKIAYELSETMHRIVRAMAAASLDIAGVRANYATGQLHYDDEGLRNNYPGLKLY